MNNLFAFKTEFFCETRQVNEVCFVATVATTQMSREEISNDTPFCSNRIESTIDL